MRSRNHDGSWEITDDIHIFFHRTGIIFLADNIKQLGLDSADFRGHFDANGIEELNIFCAINPQYHIITMTQPGIMKNRYLDGNRFYFLADGDKNPNLALDPFLHKSAALFEEEMLDKALAKFTNVN